MVRYFAYLNDDVFVLQKVQDEGTFEENFAEVLSLLPEGFTPKYNNVYTMAFDLSVIDPKVLGGVLEVLTRFTDTQKAQIQTLKNVDLHEQITQWKSAWNALGPVMQSLVYEQTLQDRKDLFILDAVFSAYGMPPTPDNGVNNNSRGSKSRAININGDDENDDKKAESYCRIL